MKKNYFIACLILCTFRAQALSTDHEQLLTATSDSAVLTQSTLTAEYIGHVVVKQGTTKLNADRLLIKLNAQHQIESIFAFGNPTTYTTLLPKKTTPLAARAGQIQYYPAKHLVVLLGNAVVTQSNDTYSANTIYYNTLTQSVESPKEPGKQIKIVIQPKEHS